MLKEYSPDNKAWYALRRTLPPWRWQENLDELVSFCIADGVDEVIVKVDVEEFSHGQVPMQWLDAYLPHLFVIRDALEAAGVYYSLNPWITMCHCDRGRDNRQEFPDMVMVVGHDGTQCLACACPLSTAWRAHTVELWRKYSTTAPKVMWVEDDIRTWNHEPASYGCFCSEHLKKFGSIIGGVVTREQVVEALLKPGEPHPWRKLWLDMQGDIMIDVVDMLTKTVQTQSPDTLMGLMSSGPGTHCLEGRKWFEFGKALQGRGEYLLSRPPLGIYAETSMRGLYYSANSIRQTRKALAGIRAIEQSEVDNFPMSTYAKSVAVTSLQISVSVALGCEGATMNLFDHMGNPMSDIGEFGKMLVTERALHDGLAQRSSSSAKFAGVGILQRETATQYRHLGPDADYSALADDGSAWADSLQALGVAVTWDTENSEVLALSGQTVRAYSDAEITEMLSHGVLCDLDAAQALQEMGYGSQIGIASLERKPIHKFGPISAEELVDPRFGGAPDKYLTATVPGLSSDTDMGWMELLPGAVVASRMVDPDRTEICPFVTVFENKLGGRVAILPYAMSGIGEANSFLHPYRRDQLVSILTWLNNKPLPMLTKAGAYTLPIRSDNNKTTRITLFNFSLDDYPEAVIEIYAGHRAVDSVEQLDSSGKWVLISSESYKIDDSVLSIKSGIVTYKKPAAWQINWK